MIKIHRIKINNFRQFRDIEIEFDESKGVFLFIGKNGIGKSNFLNAVCWCLYGKQPFKIHDQDKRLLNEEVAESNPNSRISVELEVYVDNDIYSIRRSKTEIQNDNFIVMRKVDGDWLEMPNPTIIRENFLPESIVNFFFFDGEAIQNLFKGDYAENIKNSVWKVSDVEIIDNALNHMKITHDDLRKKITKVTPKEKKKEEELTIHENNLGASKIKLQNAELLNETQKENISNLRKEEKRYTKYRDLYKQKEILENQLSTSEKNIKEYQTEINTLVCDIGPFYYAKEGLKEVGAFVGNDINKGEIPSDIKGKFILDLINNKKCICGNHISEDGPEYKELKKLLDVAESKDEREVLLKDSYFIDNILNEIKLLPIKMEGLREKRARERKEIEKLQRQIKELKEQLKNAPDKEVGDLEKTIQHAESQNSDLLKEIGSLKKEIEIIITSIEIIRKEINEEILKRGQHDKISKEFSLIENSIEHLETIREKIIRQVGSVVSLKTEKYFKELIWKKGEFDQIKFDQNYEINVHKTGSNNVSTLRDLSTGELKVLGFATLKALAEISGFKEVPVFIDGPLEYLDEEVKSNFIGQLPNFMPEKQVFVFSVDHESILKFGNNNVKPSNFFRLKREGDSLSTRIVIYKQ